MKELDKASLIIKSGFKALGAKKDLGWKICSHFKVVRGAVSISGMSLQISIARCTCVYCAYALKGLRKAIFLEGEIFFNGPGTHLGNPKFEKER